MSRSAKPDFKKLGPRLGKLMKPVAAIIQQWQDNDIDELEQNGKKTVEVDGTVIEIQADEIQVVEQQAGQYAVSRDREIVVGLDPTITPELEQEGLAREFVNRIQNLRKESNFDVTDRIRIFYRASEKLRQAIQAQADYIKAETLAMELIEDQIPEGQGHPVTIGEESAEVSIEKVD